MGAAVGSTLSQNHGQAATPAALTTDVQPEMPATLCAPTPPVLVVTATAPPAVATVTPVPSLQPSNPAADLQALVAYAETVKLMLDEGLAAAERDGAILEASEQNPEALCGAGLTPHPTLLADAALMDSLLQQLGQVTAPAEAAAAVHKPLLESVRLWGEALDNINRSCETANPAAQGLHRLGAALQLGGAMINFHVAGDNFWRLMILNGLEAIVGTPLP